MIKKIKNYLLIALSLITMSVPALVPSALVSAAGCTHIGDQIVDGANGAAGTNNINCADPSNSTEGIKTLAKNIVNVFSIIVGIVAVIMVIYAGFRYITSGGESGSVGNAKNTLIYAIVGLIIVALAQVIVRFVLSSTSTVNQ